MTVECDFTRGYIDAITDGKELAPTSLKFVIDDCLKYKHANSAHLSEHYQCNYYNAGAKFWQQRQSGKLPGWPALLVLNSLDGKVYL